MEHAQPGPTFMKVHMIETTPVTSGPLKGAVLGIQGDLLRATPSELELSGFSHGAPITFFKHPKYAGVFVRVHEGVERFYVIDILSDGAAYREDSQRLNAINS